ncbi:MAG: cation transporter [Clostridiales bacterium]|nr:cation transporter [Clostridiales bacterium]
METATLTILGMECEHCVRAVTQAAQGVPGVSDVKVSLEGQTATITYDPDESELEEIFDAIEDQGYEIEE